MPLPSFLSLPRLVIGGGGGVSLTLDFSASALSINSDGDVDSFTDSGFGEDNESTLSVSYEGELFGGVASLGFGPQTFRFINGEMADGLGETLFSLSELYVWIKPFGPDFKFTGGIFENSDGMADYTDDIDNFGMGVFIGGEGGPFTEPEETSSGTLANGFLAEAAFGPVTVQVLFGPNFSVANSTDPTAKFIESVINNSPLPPGISVSLPTTPPVVDSRLFRIGGRIIADLGAATVSAMFKTFQIPMSAMNDASGAIYNAMSLPFTPFPGDALNMATFGAYTDITAVENLGVSVGYTGYMVITDDGDYENVLWNGIDLRATWTGIEGVSLSTHNNISFASGVEKDWFRQLGKDQSFFTLSNAIGATVTLTDTLGVNGEIGNILSKTDRGGAGDIDFDRFWGQVKLIASVTENAEFTAGLRVEFTTQNGVDDSLVFSVPVGIKVSF